MVTSPPPAVASARARVANRARRYGADAPEVAEAQRELAVEGLAAHVRRVVDAAPPLTDRQLDRLTTLLRPADPADPAVTDVRGATRARTTPAAP